MNKNIKNLKRLWLALPLMLCIFTLSACNNDDEDGNIGNLLGYWEDWKDSDWHFAELERSGYYFKANGKINYWEQLSGEYNESYWGDWWVDENGEIKMKWGGKDLVIYDEVYYAILQLTKNKLVIRTYGGFVGTPFEKGNDHEFIKLDKRPDK